MVAASERACSSPATTGSTVATATARRDCETIERGTARLSSLETVRNTVSGTGLSGRDDPLIGGHLKFRIGQIALSLRPAAISTRTQRAPGLGGAVVNC
jgi:hypothetical protein